MVDVNFKPVIDTPSGFEVKHEPILEIEIELALIVVSNPRLSPSTAYNTMVMILYEVSPRTADIGNYGFQNQIQVGKMNTIFC